jgi:hypothetical protein
MTTSDYLLDIALIAIVFRQVRESRLGLHAILLPLGICGFVGAHYLRSLPTAGNDLVLIVGLTVVGIALGTVSALATRVRRDGQGRVLVKAGWIAAGAWILGMGFRFAFSVWASHGGAADLGSFSVRHDITSDSAWTDALVLMAFGEVFTRTGVLVLRAHRTRSAGSTDQPQLVTA